MYSYKDGYQEAVIFAFVTHTVEDGAQFAELFWADMDDIPSVIPYKSGGEALCLIRRALYE